MVFTNFSSLRRLHVDSNVVQGDLKIVTFSDVSSHNRFGEHNSWSCLKEFISESPDSKVASLSGISVKTILNCFLHLWIFVDGFFECVEVFFVISSTTVSDGQENSSLLCITKNFIRVIMWHECLILQTLSNVNDISQTLRIFGMKLVISIIDLICFNDFGSWEDLMLSTEVEHSLCVLNATDT